MANVAQGGGSENMEHYKGGTGAGFGVTKKAYLGVDNIHVMRDSLARVVEALRDADRPTEMLTEGAYLDGSSPESSSLSVLDRQALRRSGWVKHLSAILQGTLVIIRTVHVASSHVLVHCSDGWDRTAQVTALAQLCLDPYYRTIRGFMVLIEKEWVSFGHKFLDRCGHLSSERFFIGGSSIDRGGEPSDEPSGGAGAFIAGFRDRISNPAHIKEMSPVFHQFLECVRNIQLQFPERFEFNEAFLRKIHYHLYACEFGTFLFNCERERRVSLDGASSWSGIQKTQSVWEWFLSDENMKERKWNNPEYNKGLDDIKGGAGDMGVLIPNARNVRFWHELYGKGDEEMNGKPISATVAPDLESKTVTEAAEDAVTEKGVTKGIKNLSLMTEESPSEGPSRNGTPLLSSSVTSASGVGATSRNSSPAILPVSESPPIPTATKSPDLGRPTAPRQDSFRPVSTSSSAFSLRSSPTLNSRPTPAFSQAASTTSTPSSEATSLYHRPAPPQPMVRASPEGPQGFGTGGFSAAAFADGFSGFASNAGGGMKSMWGRLSTNATAAFSAVQDAAKDFRSPVSGVGGVFTGYTNGPAGGTSASSDGNRRSTLGWADNDPWSASPSSSSTRTPTSTSPWATPQHVHDASVAATVRPRPQAGLLRSDTLSSNPWSTSASPAAINTPSRVRTLEDEWKSVALPPPALNTPSQVTPGHPLQNSTIYASPAPRHASSLSPPLPADRILDPPQKGAEIKPNIDPLGVGPL